jgi:hypothetical protein
MAFQNSVIIAICLSLGACFLSFVSGLCSAGRGTGEGYGVLSLDQGCPDRTVGAALTAAGIEAYYSESNQWAYLDDFGELVKIPLDEYRKRLEPFDPRNDGYAEALDAFFVRNGTRRFYIPLEPGKGDPRKRLAGRVAGALGDTPYSLEFLVSKPPFSRHAVSFVFFGAAVLGSVFLSGRAFQMAFLIPPCVPLVFLGLPGFVLGGMLFGFSGSLCSSLDDFCSRRRRGEQFFRRPPGSCPGPFSFSQLMPLLFAASYWVIVSLGGVPVRSALPVFISCCVIPGILAGAEPDREGHVRFRPVPIRKPRLNPLVFLYLFKRNCPPAILPWAPASVFALLLSLILPWSGPEPDVDAAGDISLLYSRDYEAHFEFQRSFSLRPLGAGKNGEFPEHLPSFDSQADSSLVPAGQGVRSHYYHYSIGEDGLITGTAAGNYPFDMEAENPDEREHPPFLLADLMDFLEGHTPVVNQVHTRNDLISIAFIVALAAPPFIHAGKRERKKRSLLILNDKRVAA